MEWIKCSERLPEKGFSWDVWSSGDAYHDPGRYADCIYDHNGKWFEKESTGKIVPNPTHWMPITAPPQPKES